MSKVFEWLEHDIGYRAKCGPVEYCVSQYMSDLPAIEFDWEDTSSILCQQHDGDIQSAKHWCEQHYRSWYASLPVPTPEVVIMGVDMASGQDRTVKVDFPIPQRVLGTSLKVGDVWSKGIGWPKLTLQEIENDRWYHSIDESGKLFRNNSFSHGQMVYLYQTPEATS